MCVCVCVCMCVYVCVCVCVCVLCSGCTDAFAQHIHMHQGVNQHEGMFMYSALNIVWAKRDSSLCNWYTSHIAE